MLDLEIVIWASVALSLVLVVLVARALVVLSEVRDDSSHMRRKLARLEAHVTLQSRLDLSHEGDLARPD